MTDLERSWTVADVLAACPDYTPPEQSTRHRKLRRPLKPVRPAAVDPSSPAAGWPPNPTNGTSHA